MGKLQAWLADAFGFTADQQGAGLGQVCLPEGEFGVHLRAVNAQSGDNLCDLLPFKGMDGQVEVGTHAGTHHLGREGVCRAGGEQDGLNARRFRRAQDGAQVAGVAQVVED